MQATRSIRGIAVPTFMYGTAWKEAATAACVTRALAAGFRAIDTANQRKHYVEADVGTALAAAALPRDALFVQTKFTYQRGQDDRLPYDPRAPLPTQVAQSVASSRDHLGLDVIDSLVLHGPAEADDLTDDDRAVWRAMEAEVDAGRVRLLGISNVNVGQVEALLAGARIAPAFVQNRCYASRGWDRAMRTTCAAHDLVYQGFSLLTANRAAVDGPVVGAVARRLDATPAQVVFAFALAGGILPLTGSRDATHLRDDLTAIELAPALTAAELAAIDAAG